MSFGNKPRQDLDRASGRYWPIRLPSRHQHQPFAENCPANRAGDAPARRAPQSPASGSPNAPAAGSRHSRTQSATATRRHPAAPAGSAYVPDDRLVERNHARSLAAIRVRILPLQLLRDRRHIGLRRLDRTPSFKPRDSVEAVAAPPDIAPIVGLKRRPKLSVSSRRKLKTLREARR